MKILKKIVLLCSLAVLFVSTNIALADVWVNGYTKSNGTYVNGYYRSSPDSSPYNNYSYPGNTNPYTGKTAGGSTSGYLNNYSGSSFIGKSGTLPTYIPTTFNSSSIFPSLYTLTYSSGSSYDDIYESLKKKEITISTIAKHFAGQYDCSNSVLSKEDKADCKLYKNNKNKSNYTWNVKSYSTNDYAVCGENIYPTHVYKKAKQTFSCVDGIGYTTDSKAVSQTKENNQKSEDEVKEELTKLIEQLQKQIAEINKNR